MPNRLSKSTRRVLLRFAKNQAQGIRVDFLLEPLTTQECKVMRQLVREPRKNPYAVANTKADFVEQILKIADGEIDAKTDK